MRKNILFITSCLLAATTFAEDINTLPKDTTKVIDIEEVVVIASPISFLNFSSAVQSEVKSGKCGDMTMARFATGVSKV